MQHEPLGIDQNVPFLALGVLSRVIAVRIDRGSSFLRSLYALGINDCRSWTCFTRSLLTTFHIQRVVHLLQCAVVGPSFEIVVNGALGWQIFRHGAPLAAGAEDVHHPVDGLADVDRAFVAAGLGGWDQRPDLAPLFVAQIALVAQMTAGVALSVLLRPHTIPPNRCRGDEMVVDSTGSSRVGSPTQKTQFVPGRT